MACGQRWQMGPILHQFTHFHLIKSACICLALCRIGLRTQAGLVEEAGFLGTDLQFSYGQWVGFSLYQTLVRLFYTLIRLAQPNLHRAAVVVFHFA
ncbi:hypothetical protein D3C79_808310 [compost metagenome]